MDKKIEITLADLQKAIDSLPKEVMFLPRRLDFSNPKDVEWAVLYGWQPLTLPPSYISKNIKVIT